jgi:pimeloyl-ACP methyl ester carboxylesterase
MRTTNQFEEKRTGFAPVQNGQLYYEVSGQGLPLVLVHASCADHTMWDEQLNFFAPYFQVIRYDRRGFGKTTANQLEESIPFFDAQDLAALLNHLEVEKAFVLGLSGGGLIAVDFSLAFAHRVRRLVLASAGYSGAELQATPQEYALFNEYLALLPTKDWEKLAALGAKVWTDGPQREAEPQRRAIRERVYQWLLASHRRAEGMLDARAMRPPAAGRLDEIKVSVLVMWGEQDFSGTIASGEDLASQIEGAKKAVFKDSAHLLNLERPIQFNQLVLDFLENQKL